MQTQLLSIGLLEPNTGQIEGLPKNPRFIRDERFAKLVQSIQDDPEMLALRECLVYPVDDKFVVIGGNMRLRACRDLKYKEIPCKVLPVETPVEKLRAYTIKDNIGFGQDDTELLANEWDIDELSHWGVEVAEWNSIDDEPAAEEDNYDGSLPDEPETVPGDLYELNEHRVQCGDSTDTSLIDKLMNGREPYMVFTDPPYGFEFEKIQDIFSLYYDKLNMWLIDDVNAVKLSHLHIDRLFGIFVWIAANKNIISNKQPIRSTVLIPCFNFKSVKEFDDGYNFHFEHGRQSLLIHQFGTGHIKPIELYTLHIDHLTPENCIVLDYFLHSGTCLLACEQLGRTCYAQELEPKYVDVAVKRWVSAMKAKSKPFTVKRNGIDITSEGWLAEGK